jgi:predicted DNA-binding transcriptional regulator AlpA
MPEYQVTFRTSVLTAEQEDALLDAHDAFVGGHGDVTLVTMTGDGPDGLTAADRLSKALAQAGIQVLHIEPDFVSVPAIASRSGVTRQAVANWLRRPSDPPFPQPAVLTGSHLWRWQEVNEWLRATGREHDDVGLLTRAQEACIDSRLVIRARAGKVVEATFSWTPLVSAEVQHSSEEFSKNWNMIRLLGSGGVTHAVYTHSTTFSEDILKRHNERFREVGFMLEKQEDQEESGRPEVETHQ